MIDSAAGTRKTKHAAGSPPGKLDRKVALITGGTSGIGRVTAKLLAEEGAKVAITGRRVERGRSLVDEIAAAGGVCIYISADHTLEPDCRRVIAEVIKTFGRIDVLFNNAGIVLSGTAETTSEKDWSYCLDLNVTAVWRMSKLALGHMRSQGSGAIINNASDWGVVGARDAVAYCASKGAVIQMTKAMALDHARDNIRINAVCPGDTFVERWMEEGYVEASGPVEKERALMESGAALPMGRVAMPEEIAQAVLFLASDDSSYITGTALLVDGGNTAQ